MTPDWNRIFPDADHRWIMGLRQNDSVATYFKDVDPTGAMRNERVHWLDDEPEKYAALLPEAYPALIETVELAQSLGAIIDDDQPRESSLLGLGRAWEPDFVWMHPDRDGVFRLIGGVVCFPSSWALQEKVGRPMSEIHDPVPALNEALGRQIDTFLKKMAPGVPWRRENWSLSRSSELNQHVSRARRRLDATITVDEVSIRLEHQLLLKLPQSESLLFGIRLEVVPLKTMVENAPAAMRFARILSTIPEAAAAYKGFETARMALLEMLRT